MISFPNAKINIGLNVIERREDGFHNVESVMVPITYCDSLEIILNGDETTIKCDLGVLGNSVKGAVSDNLIFRAYELVASQYELPAVRIRLLKTIPMGAGLGGGSADAAFTIRMLNDLCGLDLSTELMQTMCAELGSDCSFFIENHPALVSGRGEKLQSINLDLSGYCIVVIYPNLHINTKEAYSAITSDPDSSGQLAGMIQEPIENWKNGIQNAFESSVFDRFPELSSIKDHLYQLGAEYATMTGSGSAIIGIFEKETTLDLEAEFSTYAAKSCKFL